MKASTKAAYPNNWKEISIQIRTERGNICELCGCSSTTRNVLTVHHIDFNPANTDPLNLIVLCQKCHLRSQQWRGVKPLFTIKPGGVQMPLPMEGE